MDNFDPVDAGARWSTPRGVLLCTGLGALAATAWCLLGPSDPAGRLLIGITAAALAAVTGYGLLARPRLVADRHGLRIGSATGQRVHPWADVRRVRVVRTRRLGRDVPSLEIETAHVEAGRTETGRVGTGRTETAPGEHPEAERLDVFSRLELGADPYDVADVLTDLRSRA